MSQRRSHRFLEALLVGGLFYGTVLVASVSRADVTSSGLGTQINTVGSDFNISGGTPSNNEANLFHSFGNFSLDSSQRAVFLNTSGWATQNILSRVTGGNPSNIYGTIDTTAFPNANLFLINPAGILFGPTAQLNVGGSFHATTADYIGLDGKRFDPNTSVADAQLITAAPSAFGFLTANPAPIDVNTSAPTGVLFEVPSGQTMSFVGGTINMGTADGSAPGYVMAPAGTLNLVSVASPGEATFNSAINVDAFAQLGDINIRGNSMIDAKDVYIRAGQLTMGALADSADPSSPVLPGTIAPGVFSLFGLGPEANGGEVNIKVTGDVIIAGDVPEPLLGNPGGIISFAGFSNPTGKVPDVTIDAGGSVSLSGYSGIQLQRFGSGDPAQVTVNADSIRLEKGASISLLNFFEGPGGNITLNTQQEINISGDGSIGPTGATGLLAQGLFHPFADFFGDPAYTYADSGSITVNTGTLRVSGDGIITTTSIALGSSSDININAHDILLSGRPAHINANSFFAGPSGDININASGQIEIKDGFVIFADTNGTGAGGSVNIMAAGPITVSGDASGIATQTAPPSADFLDFFAQSVFGFSDYAALVAAFEPFGLPPDANMFQLLAFLDEFGFTSLREPLEAGHAGSISVATPMTLMVDGQDSAIDSGSGWDGNAGNVLSNTGTLMVSGGAEIRSRSGLVDLTTNEPLLGTGDAGSVTLNATGTISVTGSDSSISTSTFGDGDAGSISLNANQINIQDSGSVTSESGGMLASQFLVGTGNAGTLTIDTTDSISVSGGSVSTTTSGVGQGGDIELASKGIEISGGGSITSEALSTGDAGTILIAATAPLTISGTNSRVSTTSTGAGAGGSIELTGNNVQILYGGSVTADSFSTGNTGNIIITAGNKIDMSEGTISTLATTSDGGNIKLTAPKWVYLLDSDITTSVEKDFGNGGNINIDPQFVILNHSNILANAYEGTGGFIDIVADNIIVSADSRIDAASELGIDGTVNLSNPDQDIAKELAVLPENYLDVTGLISDRCGTSAGASSLVSAGPGGLAVDPDGYLPSFGAASNVGYNGKGESSGINSGISGWALATDLSALQLARVNCTY